MSVGLFDPNLNMVAGGTTLDYLKVIYLHPLSYIATSVGRRRLPYPRRRLCALLGLETCPPQTPQTE